MEMNQYIFITKEGFTLSPNCTVSEPDIENCQVLGFEYGNNDAHAFKEFIQNNLHLENLGFKEVICYKLGNTNIPKYFTII